MATRIFLDEKVENGAMRDLFASLTNLVIFGIMWNCKIEELA